MMQADTLLERSIVSLPIARLREGGLPDCEDAAGGAAAGDAGSAREGEGEADRCIESISDCGEFKDENAF